MFRLACAIIVYAGPVLADDGFEFRGDRGLLQTARDAQESSFRAFPRGSLTASASLVPQTKGSSQLQQAHVRLCWDGEKTSWTYDFHEERGQEGATHQTDVRLILVPAARFWYGPAVKLAQIDPEHRSIQPVLKLRPDHLWYCIEGRPEEPWSDHLNPEKYRNGRLAFSVDRGVGSEVIVKRDYRFAISGHELESSYTYVADMAAGGNIVRYEKTPLHGAPQGVDALGTKGEFIWKPVGDGRFYCQSCWYCQYESDPDDPLVKFEMTIEEFDPNPTIAADQFTLAGLKLEPGTTVEDKTGRGRVYKFGNEPVTLTTENLNRLVDEQRGRGFANPDRKSSR